MRLSTRQKKILHSAVGGLGAGAAYAIFNSFSLPADLRVPLLALLVGAIIRAAGAILSAIETKESVPQ